MARGALSRYPTPAAGASTRQLILDAFEERYTQVYRYIAVRIGDSDIAEDLASETFTRTLRSADKFRDRGMSIGPWLFRIAHNLVVDHIRTAKRRPFSTPLDGVEPSDGTDVAAEAYERKQEISFLHEALKLLTESERQVIALRFGAEMKPEAIGQVLGKKAGAVRWLQHSAISKMRRDLGPRLGIDLAGGEG